MARSLYVYQLITPNKGQGTHYLYDPNDEVDVRLYMTALSASLLATIPLDNYRINNNVAKVNATATLTGVLNNITYVIDYDNEGDYFRAYWVDNSALQSGFIVLNLSVDFWASTFAGYTQLHDMHVTRCNRQIDHFAYFDDIKKFKALSSAQGYINSRLGNDDLAIDYFNVVFQLSFNVSSGSFGNNQITRTALYTATARSIRNALSSVAEHNYADINTLEVLADALGGVYQVSGNNKAQILRAWIIPSTDISNAGYDTEVPESVKTKSHYSDLHDATFNVYAIAPRVFTYSVDIASLLNSAGYSKYDFQCTHNLVLGAINNGLKLRRSLNTLGLYKITYGMTELRVTITDGANEIDITNAFEFSVTGNNATESTLTRILNCLGTELSIGAGVFKGAQSGGTAGAWASAVSALGGILSSIKDATPLSPISTGDAGTSYFAYNKPLYLAVPYRLYYMESENDEIENALYRGANVDTYVDDLSVPPTKSFLVSTSWTFDGVSKTFARGGETFIAIDELKITGAQSEAEKYIKEEFARGIFYKIL